MKAIQVKYLPATTFKGDRIKAWTEGKNSVTQTLQYELGAYDNACEAAYSLALKLGWNLKFKGGCLPNGDYCFVIIESAITPQVE